MRIACDARILALPDTGMGIYAKNLLGSLLSLKPDWEWHMFTHKEIPEDYLKKNQYIEHLLPFPDATQLRVFWDRYYLPLHLRKVKADLFFSPLSVVPYLSSSPSVVTIHDVAFLKLPGILPPKYHNYWCKTIARAAFKAKSIIAVSKQTKQDIIERWPISGSKIHVIPEGVANFFFEKVDNSTRKSILKKYNINRPYIFYLSTLEPRKNANTLLRAYEDVHKDLPRETDLVIAGAKGWLTSEEGEYFSVDRPNCHILGYVPKEDLRALYQSANLFVFPSLYEGFGLPLLESMASGVPIIASDVAAIPEVVGSAARLFPPRDVVKLGEIIIELLSDDKQRTTLSKRGLERVKNFTWERAASATAELFEITTR